MIPLQLKRMTGACAAALLAVPLLAAPGSAAATVMIDDHTVLIDYGRMENNRMLIPLRAVAENLGAKVEWNQTLKTIAIAIDGTAIRLAIDSAKVRLGDDDITLDVAARLIHNTTYVPLRFVGQALGAEVAWNQAAREATITPTGGNDIVVRIEQDREEPPAAQKATAAWTKTLADKLNEAADVSGVKQIRATFRPYFTDRFINAMITAKGLAYKEPFGGAYGPYYNSKTTASIVQTNDHGTNEWGDLLYLDRSASLVYENGVWKVDAVVFREGATPIAP